MMYGDIVIEKIRSKNTLNKSDKNTYTIARKVRLAVDGDKKEVNRVYQFLRDGIYNQNKAYNIFISSVYSAIINGASTEELNEIYKRGSRKPKEDDEAYSLYKFGEIEFPVGVGTTASLKQMVKNDLKKAKNDGLFKGKISLPNRKLNAPLRIESACFSFIHNYNSYQEFLDHLYTDDCEIIMKFVNNIRFKVNLGQAYKTHELRSVFQNIFEENYKVCGSSIEIDGTKIILNLSLTIPKKKHELDESIVVGVDLGIAVPAVCSLNNNTYIKKFIGSRNDFLRERTKLKAQRRNVQKSLKFTSGGHGRKKKLRHLEVFTEHEKNWVKNYNHRVSKEIVDFALSNDAKYINIENLQGFDSSNFLLANWSYYQLQQQIEYKADMHGIIVRKVNPYHTSQRCSCCGLESPDNRPKGKKGQAYFKCLNCGAEMNADFNASQNIARSTDFSIGEVTLEENKKKHNKSKKIPKEKQVA